MVGIPHRLCPRTLHQHKHPLLQLLFPAEDRAQRIPGIGDQLAEISQQPVFPLELLQQHDRAVRTDLPGRKIYRDHFVLPIKPYFHCSYLGVFIKCLLLVNYFKDNTLRPYIYLSNEFFGLRLYLHLPSR